VADPLNGAAILAAPRLNVYALILGAVFLILTLNEGQPGPYQRVIDALFHNWLVTALARTIALQDARNPVFAAPVPGIPAGFRISAHRPIEKPRSILLRFTPPLQRRIQFFHCFTPPGLPMLDPKTNAMVVVDRIGFPR
jgi:hypothetical protein